MKSNAQDQFDARGLGTYHIVTFHNQGVVIWSGSRFIKINKFANFKT